MTGKKVVVGLSGGVDSSVAAALLIEQGYDVHGVYLECYNEPGCRTDQDKKDALQVALKLGIRFEVLDFRKEYKEKVVEYFYSEYKEGRTPNPDVMCNREIKFGIFYDWAMQQGYEYVATGHYARILTLRVRPLKSDDDNFKGRTLIARARDESKDQSYFLWQIPGDHLEHVLFPLGEMLKSEVRIQAEELGLANAKKPDSMGICFIGEVNVNALLKERLGEKEGEVIMKITNNQAPITKQTYNNQIKNKNSKKFDVCNLDVDYLEDDYEVVGRHRGLWFYTIGSRGGWEMDPKRQKSNMPPLYVIGKDKAKNQLIVGSREETMMDRFEVEGLRLEKGWRKLWVRIRNLGELVEVEEMRECENAKIQVILKEKIFGVAEGQSSVFYDESGILVGGSIIV